MLQISAMLFFFTRSLSISSRVILMCPSSLFESSLSADPASSVLRDELTTRPLLAKYLSRSFAKRSIISTMKMNINAANSPNFKYSAPLYSFSVLSWATSHIFCPAKTDIQNPVPRHTILQRINPRVLLYLFVPRLDLFLLSRNTYTYASIDGSSTFATVVNVPFPFFSSIDSNIMNITQLITTRKSIMNIENLSFNLYVLNYFLHFKLILTIPIAPSAIYSPKTVYHEIPQKRLKFLCFRTLL